MKLTLIQPCMGRKPGEKYLKTWQMEPLAPAVLKALTPPDIAFRFYDDRMESIPYDEPTDLVAITVETYTAKRAYQIATEYRKRGVPVVMGGFHATLVPDEVSQYAESIVIGEAEEIWPQVLADFRAGRMRRIYRQEGRTSLAGVTPDRSIFADKRYLPIGLVETGRGCHFKCEFCAVQAYYGSKTRRPIDEVIAEIRLIQKPLIFFVDDNIASNMAEAKEFLRALIPLKIRWMSQGSIDSAHDEEYLQLLKESGCYGLLIGFESLNPANLKQMHKGFNTMNGGYEVALENLRRYGIRLYPTFIFGYDNDTPDSFAETLAFALRHKFYIAAFNHLLPFPGTPLYTRLEAEGRLQFDRWWLDDDYRYGMVPFTPAGMTAQQISEGCLDARLKFYTWPSMLRRSVDPVNASNPKLWSYFMTINYLMHSEVLRRYAFALGDPTFEGSLLKVAHEVEAASGV